MRGSNERQQPPPPRRQPPGWGDRMSGGAVHGGITADGRVWVNCQLLGVGVTARITPEQAEDLAEQLLVWVRQARS